MAINPFRVGELQLPQPLRPVPIDFSPLQSIGEGIGQYRQQQAIGSILAGATGPDGQLDLNKAASGLAAAGFAGHAERLVDSALKQKALTSAEANRAEERRLQERQQDITAGHYTATEKDLEERRRLDQERLDLEKRAKKYGTIYQEPHPLGLGSPTYKYFDPDTNTMQVLPPGAMPPAATTPAPTSVGPRSDVAPGVAPAGAPTFADRFDPENAPPTRVAGLGPTAIPGPAAPQAAPGVQTAQAAPAPAAAPANPALQQVEQQYGPQAAAVLKDILEYKRAPLKGKEEAWITLARSVDPTYDPLQWETREKEAKASPRQFGVADIEKLTEEGSKARDTLRFAESFNPKFAGYKASIVGNTAMAIGRSLGDEAKLVGKDLPQAAQWWQDYDEFKNAVRKGTFGATLTGLEREAFERASINPGMDPKQIQENLARQKLLVTDVLKRKATGLISAGYDPKVIAETYGLDLKQLGVTEEGKRRGGSTAVETKDGANDAIGRARAAYKAGAPRDAVLEQMRKDRIPNPEKMLGN